MDLSQLISEAAAKYPVAKQQSFGGNAIADLFKSDIPDLLRTKLNLPESKFEITGSIGTGNFAAVPWIAIMNREFTESTQNGIYIVFLFSTDGRTVYLSLNQGVTYLKGKHFKKDKIRDIASRLRDKFTNPNKYMGPINLEATTELAKGYENTNIRAFKYDIDNMPSENELLSNLNDLFQEYSAITDMFIEKDKSFEKFYSGFIEDVNDDNLNEPQVDYVETNEGEKIPQQGWNTILYGPPGTGKTYSIKKYRESLKNDQDNENLDTYTNIVTFHQSYGYEDFIEGIVAETDNGQIIYKVKDGIFKEFCNKAKSDPEHKYLFVIDEINRGNISKIFGELITLIEPSKRLGQEEGMILKLPYSGDLFGVPSNLYLLGTMNTADRSITMMDTALRRRFDFIEMMPDSNIVAASVGIIEEIDVAEILDTINQRIEFLFDREHTIGHAFFIGVQNLSELQNVFENKIIPLLQEYFYEDYEKIRAILNDTNNLYVQRINQRRGNLFGRQFAELINEYDNTRYVLRTKIDSTDFKKFITNIVVKVNTTDDMYPEADE